jgi:predicted lipoprotein with Yx(FWY)xxD motif
MAVSNSQFGSILADAKGMTLYTATGDTSTTSGCTGACLKFWPPLLLPAGEVQPVAGPGVSGLGTLMRPEGVQVTYHGKPLYTWIRDTHPGQVTGNGVVDSGGTWHVATLPTATNPPTATPSTAAPMVTQAPAVTQAPVVTQAPAPPTTTAPAPSSGGASF